MAVTITSRKRANCGSEHVRYVDITGPASYTTGGEALTAATLTPLVGLRGAIIGAIDSFGAKVPTTGQTLVLDRTTSKVMYFNGTTQIANATNLSAVTARARITTCRNG